MRKTCLLVLAASLTGCVVHIHNEPPPPGAVVVENVHVHDSA